MAQYDSAENVSLHCMPYYPALPVCWLLGLISGVFLFLYAGTPVISMMHGILYGSVSIVSLFAIGFFPFLFTAYAFYLSEPRLITFICFCKACLFSFVSIGVSMAFTSAGWLMRILLLFHDSIWCVMLYFLWLRILSGRKACWFAVVTAGFLAGSITFYVISPFLACLIEF